MKTAKSKNTAAAAPIAAPARTTTVKAPAAKAPVASAPVRATAVVTPVVKAAAPAPAPRREITSECIASRAYSLWEQQGRPQGKDLELWLQAEKQIKSSQSFAA